MSRDDFVFARTLQPLAPRPVPSRRRWIKRRGSALYLAAAATVALVALGLLRDPVLPADPASTPPASSNAVYVNAGFPTRTLAIHAQKTRAPIDTVGVVDNEMGIPYDVHRVGVYNKGGSLDGTKGSVLIVGHVRYAGQGKGVLGDIDKLHKGDALVTRGLGKPQGWRVTDITTYVKSVGLPQAIFRHRGRRVLTVVTCGERDDQGRYLTNVVVEAEPVETIIRSTA